MGLRPHRATLLRRRPRFDSLTTSFGPLFGSSSIHYKGLIGALLAWWVGELNDRYLEIEANGLKTDCSELAVKQ